MNKFITPKIKNNQKDQPRSGHCWSECGNTQADHFHIFWDCPTIRPHCSASRFGLCRFVGGLSGMMTESFKSDESEDDVRQGSGEGRQTNFDHDWRSRRKKKNIIHSSLKLVPYQMNNISPM